MRPNANTPDPDGIPRIPEHLLVGRRLLIADDDAGLRGGIVELLASLDIEILEADSGPEALELMRRFRTGAAAIHAALLDLHMPGDTLPGLGGLEVLAALQSELQSDGRLVGRRPLPCILYSADLTPELEHRARTAGARAVLHKPVDPNVLRQEIARAIAATDGDSRLPRA
ncbi:CAI-1 autoinducer sensor kinase/phosphatase CqsS [Planctomycetes bacterium Pla163]|uniref:CAI-1 autoinducer sensor kinase/phosphatase CqsS n=1 Tax=Rohdeia mirabilis TaxID=2528008 RepID=A0A518CW98_9BACT|nr:CAI-1 autoinducer sensor kinase/phosphatase CqsS [Planctomycetes bacterium Pla163]